VTGKITCDGIKLQFSHTLVFGPDIKVTPNNLSSCLCKNGFNVRRFSLSNEVLISCGVYSSCNLLDLDGFIYSYRNEGYQYGKLMAPTYLYHPSWILTTPCNFPFQMISIGY